MRARCRSLRGVPKTRVHHLFVPVTRFLRARARVWRGVRSLVVEINEKRLGL